jgi:hypothetical protein
MQMMNKSDKSRDEAEFLLKKVLELDYFGQLEKQYMRGSTKSDRLSLVKALRLEIYSMGDVLER